jgi:hypothetical protein
MARGGPRPNAGRPKGAQSRITPVRKQFLREWIDGTMDEALATWAQIQSPSDKFKLWLTASEFCYPKLGRQELVGDGGGAIQVVVRKYGEPDGEGK